MKTKLVIATSLCLLVQSSVWGQYSKDVIDPAPYPINNGSFYGSIAGGAAFVQDGRVKVKENLSGASDFEYDTGSSISLRAGYDFGSWRLEGEFNHTQADVSSLDLSGGSVGVDSEFSSNAFMANALWDFEFERFVFSAGVGVGFSKVKFDEMKSFGFVAVAESEDTVFSAQLILGAAYNLSERASVGINYRYQMISDVSDSGDVDTSIFGKSDIDFDSTDISVLELFFTYRF